MVIVHLYYYISHLMDFRRFKYGIPLYNSYFIFDYNNSLYNNIYSIFNQYVAVEF